MDKVDKIGLLREKLAQVEQGGGAEKIAKQHDAGKMTAREREIDTFVETRSIDFDMQKKKVPGDGVVTGYGSIDGRLVFVAAQDFTVIGGSLGEMHAAKITKVMDMAMKIINDSGGARIEEGIDRNTLASGVIPQISVIMGPCAGGAVYSPAITDFIFMVDKTSQMFITGPQVIKSVTGEDVTFEKLGGAETHNSISGVAHFRSSSEKECIEQIKKLISYLPDNNLSDVPIVPTQDDINRITDNLVDIIPQDSNKPYDMMEIITSVVDNGDFFKKHYNRFRQNERRNRRYSGKSAKSCRRGFGCELSFL